MQTVKTKFKYADDSTRLYAFDCEDSLAPDVKRNILSINSSLSSGTADGLESFFVSNTGEELVVIDGATIESSTVVPLTIAPEE